MVYLEELEKQADELRMRLQVAEGGQWKQLMKELAELKVEISRVKQTQIKEIQKIKEQA